MTVDQVKERNAELLRFPALEAQADQLTERIRTTGVNGFRADADKLLISNNPLVMVSLSAAWEEAIRRDRGNFRAHYFLMYQQMLPRPHGDWPHAKWVGNAARKMSLLLKHVLQQFNAMQHRLMISTRNINFHLSGTTK